MDTDSSSSFFPLQQDDQFPIDFPDLSTWDVGFDQFLSLDNHHDNSWKVDPQNYKQNEEQKNLQEIECATANDQEMEKKMMHREIERQRRKEMTTLYASLRSVLPSKSIKGMRSASDQIHEATKYIRFMQNKVRKQEIKRENIKKSRESGSSSKNLPITVTVQRCSVGVEVLLSFDPAAEGRRQPRLSRILQLLLEHGLNVVDCNCNKFDGVLHYMIQSEVEEDCSNIDLEMLKTKLSTSAMED